MKVLLTGAFGNIGVSTLTSLLEQKHEVLCFDLKSKKNEKKRKKLLKKGIFKTYWGDISDPVIVSEIIKVVECIIHLAAILPPMSEEKPDLARKINIGGLKNILEAINNKKIEPKIIFTSSISIFGPRMISDPPRTIDDPLNPTDNYTHHKVECEKLLKNSGLPWTILRLAACPPPQLQAGNEARILFEIPLDQRIEFVHTRDVGQALANAVTADTIHKILLIGGGRKCQILYRDFVNTLLKAYGIGKISESAFKVPKDENDWYYTDWLDTDEAQKLLQFQSLTLEDQIIDIKKNLGWKRYFIVLFRIFARMYLLSKSEYY